MKKREKIGCIATIIAAFTLNPLISISIGILTLLPRLFDLLGITNTTIIKN